MESFSIAILYLVFLLSSGSEIPTFVYEAQDKAASWEVPVDQYTNLSHLSVNIKIVGSSFS